VSLAPSGRILLGVAGLAGLLFLGGCTQIAAWPLKCDIPADPKGACAGERCYIEDNTFIFADQLYSRFGSLALVERHLLEEEKLRSCEVNECLYRLRKVHDLP